jgi:glucan phosphoethanolaminetransferase (alkaline phosphatase superfamily)
MWQKLREFKNHFWLAFLFFILTLFQQYLFYALKSLTIVPFSFTKYLAIFLFFFVCTFVKGRYSKFIFLSLILLLNYIQMVHLSYFGTQVLPAEIWLFFAEFGEVHSSLKEELGHILIPFILTIIPLTIAWWLSKKREARFESKWINVLLVVYLIYNPARTFVTGNSWGRQPSTEELAGFNVYLSGSYFLGKILPYKLSQGHQGSKNSSSDLKVTELKPSPWDKVIFILGESTSPHNMQLFGYEKPTTPYLDSLKTDPHFFYQIALSGGVSTDISVAFLLNLGFGKAGTVKASKGSECLIKLAQKQGFETHFWSTQSKQQLRYITPYLCGNAVGDFKALEDLDPLIADENAASDLKLLEPLKALIQKPGKDFILLHQRGSHSPWNLRYSRERDQFRPHAGDDRKYHYENSILEFDHFWEKLDQILNQSKAAILVVYVSDHGEATGQEGQWGHGFLGKTSFEVPLLIKSYHFPLPAQTRDLPRYLPHYDVGLYLADALGVDFNHSPLELPKDYEIFGNDIDGFAGSAQIIYNENGYDVVINPGP